MGSGKKKLSSSRILKGKKKRKTAMPSEDGKKCKVWGVEARKMVIEVVEKNAAVLSENVQTENVKDMKRNKLQRPE